MHPQTLQFVQELLGNMFIPSHIITNPDTEIPAALDRGLRALLFGETNYRRILPSSMEQAETNTVYRFVDEYRCSYVFMRLPESSGFLWIGPYLTSFPTEVFVRDKVAPFALPEEYVHQVMKYYANLPLLQDENMLFIIAKTLGNHLWGAGKYDFTYIDDTFSDNVSPAMMPQAYPNNTDTPLHIDLLERHYENERELMHAVSQGHLPELSAIDSAVYMQGTEQRLPDTMRNRMNYLIILNTLLRKAAEQGGVHPLHIDRLSSQFALKIEQLVSIESSIELQRRMIHKYCLLVRNHSLRDYSALMGRAITLIEFDLTADLSLSALSQRLNVNSSYLSGLFRKEMGCTLTDFVNRKRIEHAVFLLNSTQMQVQSIAAECGIQDANYFIKLFKRQIGMTPNEYRRQVGR